MNRPYIICHMVTSIDGKVTGDFLLDPACRKATEVYYEINRRRKCDGFICGRVTMEGSFTAGYTPDLSGYAPVEHDSGVKQDHIVEERSGFYAVAFDTFGRLGWQSAKIIDPDGDPGYDGAQIVAVLSEQADDRYLAYLQEMGVSYLFAGKEQIDIPVALAKLHSVFGCRCLLLEGGSLINGAFLRADAVDELSLVMAPLVAGAESKPLFDDSILCGFALKEISQTEGAAVLRYGKEKP